MKWLKGLGELMLQLGVSELEFLFTHDEVLERLLRQAAADIRYMKQAWDALHDEDKLLEIVNNAPWRKSKSGTGEYVRSSLVPTLTALIKAKQGRLYTRDYVYVLSRNGKWVERYVRQRPQAPSQQVRARGDGR